jgi:plastocyanin
MDTRTVTTTTTATAAGLVLLLLVGCGTTTSHATARAQLAADSQSADAYEEVVSAIEHAGVAVCPPADGGGYIPLPRPSAEAATASSAFRYLDGRIYELGPCELPAGHRNELRAYRYANSGDRDAALRDSAARMTRPTSTFVFRDVYALELWSPNPSLDTATGQAVEEAHAAIARVPQAHHPDVPAAAAACGVPSVATERVEIARFTFCPATMTVAVGTEVTWVNDDTVAHTVTSASDSPGAPFDSGVFDPGRSFNVRFDQPGTYTYVCTLHPGMGGTIVVTG